MRVRAVRPHADPGNRTRLPVYDLSVEPVSRYAVVAGGTAVVVSNSKRVSLLDVNALLAHDSTQVARDANLISGERNEDYWLRFMQGHTPPDPKAAMVHDKFIARLKGAGLHVEGNGPKLQLMALTNKHVDEMAGDRNVQNAETVNFDKDLTPIKGGLFDPAITGGHSSRRWAAMPLAEPLPNPAFEEPIRRLLGLTQKKFEGVLAGTAELGEQGKGPCAIRKALAAVDVPRELERARRAAGSDSKGKRDEAVRKLGYLKGLDALGMRPEDWVLSRAPVLPPAYRPVGVLGSGGAPVVADANHL